METLTTRIVRAVKASNARRRDRRILSNLSDQTLKDIGMFRDRPFHWRPERSDLPF
jgi:uncharacterized protein YjiS (DUF1127 family)